MEMSKKVILLVFGILSINFGEAQIDHSKYFTVSEEDKSRWEIYAEFMEKSKIPPNQKADSIFHYAQIEYHKDQFSKSTELCKLANKLNPELSKTHLLIGKAYVSSAKTCQTDDSHKIRESVIWAAMDEWEKSISEPDESSEAKLLIERYSKYLPTKEHFISCFSKSTADEGDEYFVDCWIQKTTRIRFKKDF
jgi:hypothetical protein